MWMRHVLVGYVVWMKTLGVSWNLHVSIIKPDQYYLCFMLVAWAWRCDGFHLQTPFSCWDMNFFSFTVLCRVVYTIVWFILFLISTRYVKYAIRKVRGWGFIWDVCDIRTNILESSIKSIKILMHAKIVDLTH